MTYNEQQRRYDIDWLRVLAFAVLILYHTGMYYVADWGWHIKSDITSVPLQDLMILTNPWRMSLLFFIAAIALALVQQKYSAMQLARLRTMRLMVPLLFGMFVVVSPQVYYEALSQNLIEPGFWAFWSSYINPNTTLLTEHHSPIGLLTWNHLWFLPYLWLYSLLFILLKRPLECLSHSKLLSKLPSLVMILLATAALGIIWLLLRQQYPPTNALLGDWYNHGKYLLVFSLGYLFVGQRHWWQFMIDKRRWLLIIALLGYSLSIADRHDAFTQFAAQFDTNVLVKSVYVFILSLNHWAWIFCVLGYAGFWLNRPSKQLGYATTAILPWYMLHQTLIIVFAWWLKPLSLTPYVEAPLLLTLTVVGCLGGYEMIKRVKPLRFLCGLPSDKPQRSTVQQTPPVAAA